MSTILIVDDDPSFRGLVNGIFAPFDCKIISAATANEGLRLAREVQPDLIIMDILLPQGTNGWEAIQIIKADPELCHIPVMVVTAGDISGDGRKAIQMGCTDYIKKPFSVREFRDRVLRICSGQLINTHPPKSSPT